MPRPAVLIIIFNHRYDANIAILEEMYRERFSRRYYLVPFYDGELPNVFPVYENSYHYQGYIAQALRFYFQEDAAHYLFIADDLILHPEINEENYAEHFGLDQEASFIPEPFEVHHLSNDETLRFTLYQNEGQTKRYWWRLMDLAAYKHRVGGLENSQETPPYAEAQARLEAHGYTTTPLHFTNVYGPLPTSLRSAEDRRLALNYLKRLRHYRKEYRVDYPVVASFSDIVIVAKGTIKKFAHYCGVFAANGLFVEFAIPTALLLATEKVVTEPTLGKRGQIYWTYTQAEADQYAEAMRPYHQELPRLTANFPAERLYLHPVKLSRWRIRPAPGDNS